MGRLMCSLRSLVGDEENPVLAELELSELGDAICVMADMADRLEDMPDMEVMLLM